MGSVICYSSPSWGRASFLHLATLGRGPRPGRHPKGCMRWNLPRGGWHEGVIRPGCEPPEPAAPGWTGTWVWPLPATWRGSRDAARRAPLAWPAHPLPRWAAAGIGPAVHGTGRDPQLLADQASTGAQRGTSDSPGTTGPPRRTGRRNWSASWPPTSTPASNTSPAAPSQDEPTSRRSRSNPPDGTTSSNAASCSACATQDRPGSRRLRPRHRPARDRAEELDDPFQGLVQAFTSR
jgi:hypothetical protein